jgi:hypothetical protein
MFRFLSTRTSFLTFNTFFVNVANDIVKDVIFDGNSHPNILKIKNNTQHNTLFDFKPTDVDTVNKLVNKMNIKKATGVDQISSKLLRAGAPVLNKHTTTLVNNTIKTSVCPTRLKEAQVVPLHRLKLFSNLQGVSAKLSDNHDPF